jgi:hypothetical protein
MGYRLALVAALSLGSSGCSWVFQEHLPSDYQAGRREPRCSTSGGWQTLDVIFAGINGATAIAELAAPSRTDTDSALLIGSIAWTVIHLASFGSGHVWSNDCEEALRKYDHEPGEAPPPSRERESEAMPVVTAENSARDAPQRKIVHGAKPLYCAIDKNDPDRGACFLDQIACLDVQAKDPDTYNSCAVRTASACFNANMLLDGKRITVCSVSVKNCESQRASRTVDPDYTNVASQCGVYRADVQAQASDDESSN